MIFRITTPAWAAMLFAFGFGATMTGAATYTFVTIDYPGAYTTGVSGINDAGQAVGIYYTTQGAHERGYLYSGGVFTAIDYPGASATILTGISNTGQIVGQYYTCYAAYGCYHPFVYSAGVYTPLAEAPGSMSGTTAPFAINSSGQIVGFYVDPCFCKTHGFLNSGGIYTTIDQPGYFVTGLTGINDNGLIGGASAATCWGCGEAAGFTYQSGGFSQVLPPVAGAIVPWVSINSTGDIAGAYYSGGYHSFLLSGGTYTLLDYPGATQTIAEGQVINSSKQVGGSYSNPDGTGHGFIASPSPTYSVCLLYDPTKAAKSGSTIPIKLDLCDGSGNDLSSSSLTVHAVNVTMVSTSISGAVEDSGNADPGNDFRYDSTLGTSGGYIFNLSTKGMSTGSYVVNFTVTGDSSNYSAAFQVM